MKTQTKYLLIFEKMIQIILGILFVFSGFVKGIDPVGVSYKIKEYLELFGLGVFEDFALWISTILCAVEILIGLMLLVGVYKKLIAFVALLFMFGFTAVTLYLIIDPSSAIQECGCFGDAFRLTNTETFLKNLFFITLSCFYFWRQVKADDCERVPSSSHNRSIYLSIYLLIIAFSIPIISILYLPPFDFLPFNRGENILENIRKESPEQTDEILFIYKNKENGETQSFRMGDATCQDTSVWEYVDAKIPETQQETNYLSKFIVMDANGNDCSSVVFDDSDYTFIIIARKIETLQENDFRKIAPLYQLYLNKTINLYLFTSSELNNANERVSSYGLSGIHIYNVDEVVLKSMIRNDRGVMLVSDGVICGKWNLKQDSFKGLSEDNLEKSVRREKQTVTRYLITISSFVLVLVALVLVEKYLKKKTKKGGKVKEID